MTPQQTARSRIEVILRHLEGVFDFSEPPLGWMKIRGEDFVRDETADPGQRTALFRFDRSDFRSDQPTTEKPRWVVCNGQIRLDLCETPRGLTAAYHTQSERI